MVGRIARYKGDNQWQDMAEAGAPEKAKEARAKVAATLAPKSETSPSSPYPSPAEMTFGAIVGRGPSSDRSGKVEKDRKASAVKFKNKASKIGGILYDMTGVDHILSGQYLKDADEFMKLAEPGMGTGVDGYRTPAEDDRMTDIAGAYGMDALNVAVAGSPFSRPSNSVGMFLGRRGNVKFRPEEEAAFNRANEMAQQGADPETIRQATGWSRDKVGDWAFEISDQNMKLTRRGENYAKNPRFGPPDTQPRYGDLVDHPELYERLPDVKQNRLFIAKEYGHGKGSHFPAMGDAPGGYVEAYGPDMRIDFSDPESLDLMQTLGHETQHLVNQHQARQRGANPENIPSIVRKWKTDPKYTDRVLYAINSGENEAAATARRLGMSAEERRAISPVRPLAMPPTPEQMRLALENGTTPVTHLQEPVPREMQWSQMPNGMIRDPEGRLLSPSGRNPEGGSSSMAGPRRGGMGDNGGPKLDPNVFPEFAQQYPPTGPGTPAVDKVTGKPYLEKTLTPEAVAFDKVRSKVVKDVKKGNYEPYFDPKKREKVDPANYPRSGQTLAATMPKQEKTIAKYEAIVRKPEVAERLQAAFDEGNQFEGAGQWYYMKQLEDEFIAELGEAEGRKGFEQWARTMAQTTGGADPTGNFLAAHNLRYQRAKGEEGITKSVDMPYPVGGRYMSGNMELANKAGDKPFVPGINPKRHNFESNFLGHTDPTIDEVMMRGFDPKGPQMPEYYGPYEQVVNELAAANNVPGSEFQDKAWAGLKRQGERARGKEPYIPGPMIQHVNDSIERTARLTGLTPREVVRQNLVRAKGPMYGISGLVAADQIRRIIQQDEEQPNAY
jgi:hypothetical protein